MSIDRRVGGPVAADHDIDQCDPGQICSQGSQSLARDGPFTEVEVQEIKTVHGLVKAMPRSEKPWFL
jgi:hypothetical protein